MTRLPLYLAAGAIVFGAVALAAPAFLLETRSAPLKLGPDAIAQLTNIIRSAAVRGWDCRDNAPLNWHPPSSRDDCASAIVRSVMGENQ